MALIMTILISVSGYFILTRTLTRSIADTRSKALCAGIVLAIYAPVMILLYEILCSLGFADNASLMFAVISGVMTIPPVVMFLRRHIHDMNAWAIALLVYVAGILAVCIFFRQAKEGREINTDMTRSLRALAEGDVDTFGHFIMNIVMFVPFGILLPACCPGYLDRLSEVLVPALLFSNCIECVQMVFSLGNCDIEDIMANVAGAVLGWLLLKLYRRTERQ